MYCTFFIVSLLINAIPVHQQINFIAAQHVSHRENVISVHEQIDPLAGMYCSYLNISKPENAIRDNQQITPLQSDTAHI